MERRKILFTDYRDIEIGHLAWQTSAGDTLGVANPPLPQSSLYAEPRRVPYGVRLHAIPAVKSGPVAEFAGWGRVIYDGGLYRSWYLEINGHSKLGTGSAAFTRPAERVEVCAVESADGFQWRVAQRSPISVPGQAGFDGQTFLIDPSAHPSERYKFIYCASFAPGMHEEAYQAYLGRPVHERDARLTQETRYGLFAAVSPDGLNWKASPAPLTFHASDTDTSLVWDAGLGKYVLYTRMMRHGRRWVGRAEAMDFYHWSPVEPVIWPHLEDPPDYDIYLNGYTRYPDLPETQLMFPMIWKRLTERSEVRLYSSPDGQAWSQVPGGAVLQPGEPGEWDAEFIGGGKDLLPFGPDRVAIPYTGTPYPHKYPRWPAVWEAWKMGWASWERDRLCAVTAESQGEFWTAPVLPAGNGLRLNFRTPMAGEIRVGLAGVPGHSVDDCDPLVGDHMACQVTWRGHAGLAIPNGQPVALHFRLRCAELFAVEFC